jgi:hypothetical protein
MSDDEIPRATIGFATIDQASSLASSAIHHLLFAKGQIEHPIATLRKQQALVDQSDRSKSMALSVRRAERRLHDLLSALDRIANDIRHTLQNAKSDDLVILVRMGPSPLTAAKQQYFILLRGVGSLRNGDEGVVPAKRQVLGAKPVSSIARTAALERKLVRFLLSESGQDSQLGKALQTDLGPTNSQIFLCTCTEGSFPTPNWTHKRSLKADIRDCCRSADETSTANDVDMRELSTLSELSTSSRESGEDIDVLSRALSPFRRTVPDEKYRHLDVTPLKFPPKSDLNTNISSRIEPTFSVSQQSDLDAKRQARFTSRTEKVGSKRPLSSASGGRIVTRKRLQSRGPLSAAFVIEFGEQETVDDYDTHSPKLPKTNSWLGTKDILRSYAH